MKIHKIILTLLIFVPICADYFSYGECAQQSFVDKMVYETLLFEENPADKFINEKREINKLCFVESDSAENISDGFHKLYTKFQELKEKSSAKYGEEYVDWEWAFASNRLLAWHEEIDCSAILQRHLTGHGNDALKKILQDENTWSTLNAEIERIHHGGVIPLELNFRMDKKILTLCEEILGKTNPVTLKRAKDVIHDYSLMGDSKIALKMSKELLPKLEKAFGAKSCEVANLLRLMANDYEVLGNYNKSAETLLKVIEIDKELYGEESVPELVTDLVELNKLLKFAPNFDTMMMLEKAAKNLPEDELYRLGYFRVKNLNNPNNDMKKFVDLELAYAKEKNLIETYRKDDYIKCIDMSFEQGENARALGLYDSALTHDLISLSDCKMNLGNYHHKTLKALCHLSEDYLILDQVEDALALTQEAFDTCQKIYGNEHPCTIYAIHSLTNVYRKMNRYSDALSLDKKSHGFCKKIFEEKSGNEPPEKLTVLLDIAEDYKGLKDYSSAIKYYEEFLTKHSSKNTNALEVAQARKNLAYIYNLNGEYQKTLKLYDFLKDKDNSYSLEKLSADGLIAAQSADVLGEALIASGNKDNASKIYAQEIKNFEVVRYFNTHATIENKRKWFSQTVPYYKKAASFFADQNENTAAFIAIELCKGRTLAEQYNNLLAIYKGGLTEEDISQLENYREKISSYKDNFKEEFISGSDALKFNLRVAQLEIMDKYDKYTSQLGEKYPRYKEALTGGTLNTGVKNEKFFNPEQIKSLIPRDTCYISFSVAKKDEESDFPVNEILVFVVDDTGKIQSFGVEVEDKFFEQCELYHELNSYASISELNHDGKYLWRVGDNFIISFERDVEPDPHAEVIKDTELWLDLRKKLSEELSEKFIPDLERFAGNSSHWIISADAELNLVPFETLIYRGKKLIETVNVSYVPSLVVMKLMKDAGEKNDKLINRKGLFAMGNAVYGDVGNRSIRGVPKLFSEIPNVYNDVIDGKLSDLSGTVREIEQVAMLFPANSQKTLIGREASERNLKLLDNSGELSNYKNILFAAHGIFIPSKPELSFIVLSQGIADEEYDGYVTVGEWLGYNFNSDLIYLSACESGRGIYQAGEGIVGIPYALTIAGNKDTVMSLWKVNDETTAEFVSAFFKKLCDGKSEVDALNDTKRDFLEHHDNSIWAAFLLYGI